MLRYGSTFFVLLIGLALLPNIVSCTQLSVTSVANKKPTNHGSVVQYNLPKGMIRFGVKVDKEQKMTVTGPTLITMPDPAARYFLEYRPDTFSSDIMEFSVDPKGLLSSVSAENESKVPGIVTEAVDLVKTIALSSNIVGAEAAGLNPFELNVIFDPLDPVEVQKLTEQFNNHGLKTKITVSEIFNTNADQEEASLEAKDTAEHSVYFRTVKPIVLTIEFGRSAPLLMHEFVVPDPNAVASFDVARAPCINIKTGLTFTSGMLTHVKITKPSETLGCLKIPSSIIKAILGFPDAKLAKQSESITAETKLLDAQASLISSQLKLQELQLKQANGGN